ncbi:MAG: N-6 DNA methylase [Phascolarctobacterium sp.]|nr:N-6 DNA methylase [Phascolarctobacterium sp.]
MLGAIIGDIAGSRFERHNHKSKEFDLLTYRCRFTDDTVMSLAIAKAILKSNGSLNKLSSNAVKYMREMGSEYPHAGYGSRFSKWLCSDNPEPYNSYGNGAAMRVSACGFAATSIDDAKTLAKLVTEPTHNHPEGLKGAEAVAVSIYLARQGKSIIEIQDYVRDNYYSLDFTLDGIRENCTFDVSCQGSVPQALMAFFESTNFEDAVRNAISIGGDSDTIAAITGSVAEAYYGIPAEIRKHALTFLDKTQLKILNDFEAKYGVGIEKTTRTATKKMKYKPAEEINLFEEQIREDVIKTAIDITDKAKKMDEVEEVKVSAQELFGHLFEACNILRGPINQDEYKTYVIPILFFKRISDVYDEETEKALIEYGDDMNLFEEDELHKFLIPIGCHWRDIREKSENIGKAIVDAMNGIERANPKTMAGLFSSFDDANWSDKSKLSDERLKDLVEHMSKIRVGNNNYSADVMGDAYEFLIKKFADLSKKNAGEFYTPRSIVKLLVQILAPKPGETVYDPACGTGGMLIEAIRYMGDERGSYGKIFGQEKNLATSAIARMNLFLHGAQDFNVVREDTLRTPLFLDCNKLKTFNCVIANPPFSLKKWGASQFASDIYGRNIWGCPSDSCADFAWLQHMIKSMDPDNGRCAVVLPQGVLFHSGQEGTMRKGLIDSGKLEAVITLVSGVFYSTGVNACILFMNNNKPTERKNKVILIDASKIYTAQRAQNIMTDDDVAKVYKLYADYKDVLEQAKVVTLADIAAKDYSLTVSNYIEKPQAEVKDPKLVREEYFAALQEVQEAEAKLKELLQREGFLNE